MKSCCLWKKADLSKLIWVFTPLGFSAIGTLGLKFKIWRAIQYAIVAADRFTKLAQMMSLGRIGSLDVTQAILKHFFQVLTSKHTNLMQ